jgi:hypothetical protein
MNAIDGIYRTCSVVYDNIRGIDHSQALQCSIAVKRSKKNIYIPIQFKKGIVPICVDEEQKAAVVWKNLLDRAESVIIELSGHKYNARYLLGLCFEDPTNNADTVIPLVQVKEEKRTTIMKRIMTAFNRITVTI